MKSFLFYFFILFFIILSLSNTADAVGVTPTVLNFDNTLRGSSISQKFIVFNDADKEMTYNLSSDLFTFSPEKLIIPKKSSAIVEAHLNIPKDFPEISFTRIISIQEISKKVSGINLINAVGVIAKINVIGEPVLKGNVYKITVADAELGNPVRFTIGFSNEGNVLAVPKVIINISKNDFSFLLEKDLESVKPLESKELFIFWNASEVGEYKANTKVLLSNNLLKEQDLLFKIHDYGALEREGFLKSLNISQPSLNKVLKITGVFENTGLIPLNSKLQSEVYFEDELIEVLESEEFLINPNEQAELFNYFKITRPGSYMIKGRVLYGKESEYKTIYFTIDKSNQITEFLINEPSKATFVVMCFIVFILGLIYAVKG